MKQLQYRTRGNSIPKGKPYIYFCAHEKDFSIVFERISKKLLKAFNCAVFYDDGTENNCDEENHIYDLLKMNLFVIPVTKRFLYDVESSAMRDFHTAVKHKIPVLPILQEKDIESRFNEICGDIHLLSEEDSNESALTFDEKLKKFLQKNFISDEILNKIRAEFNAYIFLSYRKKDRLYAQELMRLIHKNEFCRDVAIWYDEFLTPGENFNEEIATALDNSNLFVLTVTPNLVNEKNYVMEIEYPRARKAKKRILPAELVMTDKTILRRCYKSIPDTVVAYDKCALAEALMRGLETIVIKENESSAEHNYLIGLAYLFGIDVEIDREIALKLITSAAEARFPQAIEKLASMYKEGDAVERNPNEELRWRKNLVEVLKEACESSCEVDVGIRLLKAMWELAQLSDYPKESRIRLCEDALDFSKQLSNKFSILKTERLIGIAYQELAQAYSARCMYDETELCLKKKLAIDERLVTKYGETICLRDFAFANQELGWFYSFSKHDNKTALKFYEDAYRIFAQLCAQEEIDPYGIFLRYTCERLAELNVELSEFDEAEKYYLELIKICEKLCQESGEDDSLVKLAYAHSKVADFYKVLNRTFDAEREYIIGVQISRSIAEKTGEGGDYVRLYGEITQLIDFYIKCKFSKSAIPYGEELLHVAKNAYSVEIDWDPYASGYALPYAYQKNAEIYKILGDWDKELFYHLLCVENVESIADDKGCYNFVCLDYASLAYRCLQKGLIAEAEKFYRKAVYYGALVARKIDLFDGIQLFACSGLCKGLSSVLRERGEVEESTLYDNLGKIVEGVSDDCTKGLVKWYEFAEWCLEYANCCEKSERLEWRVRVLEFYDSLIILTSDTRYKLRRDNLYCELTAEEANLNRIYNKKFNF